MKNLWQRIKKWYSALPDKKRHIELITALLSVPMMTTVILVNLNNIKNQKTNTLGSSVTTAPIQVVIDNPQDGTPIPTSTTGLETVSPTKIECKNEIGAVTILSPLEGEIITSDVVTIVLATDNGFCPVTWSYRLGNDNWSNFSSNNVALYNLTPGKKQIQVKVKNAAGDKNITLERDFIYKSSNLTPTASPSATINP